MHDVQEIETIQNLNPTKYYTIAILHITLTAPTSNKKIPKTPKTLTQPNNNKTTDTPGMLIKILTPSSIANQSHRSQEQQVDVLPTDRISDVKVKCSLIYQSLDINEYDLHYNNRVLRDDMLVSDMLKMPRMDTEIALTLVRVGQCCAIF